jgi:hypothetical protein
MDLTQLAQFNPVPHSYTDEAPPLNLEWYCSVWELYDWELFKASHIPPFFPYDSQFQSDGQYTTGPMILRERLKKSVRDTEIALYTFRWQDQYTEHYMVE